MNKNITKSDFDKKPSRVNHSPRWLSLEEIKDWAIKNNIETQLQWQRFFQNNKDKIPKNIPRDLRNVFKSSFPGWGEFFGLGNRSNQDRIFRSYEESKKWATDMGIRTSNEWYDFKRNHPEKFPSDIPTNPSKTYKNFYADGGWSKFLTDCHKLSGTSVIEQTIKHVFCKFFDDNVDFKSRIVVGKKTLFVDMFCSRDKIVLEYDGGYFHKNKFKSDSNKNKILSSAGFTVIRIRGAGLKKIGEHDILINEKESHLKQIKIIFAHLSSLIKNKAINYSGKLNINEVQKYSNKDLSLFNNNWISFEKFVSFLKKHNISSRAQYYRARKTNPELFPSPIPSNPHMVYINEWAENKGWYGITGREVPSYIYKRKFMNPKPEINQSNKA